MTVTELLSHHKIRKTAIREEVLELLISAEFALTSQEIEKKIGLDRVTLYRTLNKFLEKGLIHRIDNNSTAYYALTMLGQHKNHIHFKCVACEKIECFHPKKPIEIPLPEGYQGTKTNILIEGNCLECLGQLKNEHN